MDFDAEIEDANRELQILRLAKFLVKAYYKNGSMSVMLNDGRRLDDRPTYVDDTRVFSRNVHDMAMEMARLSITSPRRPFNVKESHEPRPSRF